MLCDHVISVRTLHSIFLTRMSLIPDLGKPNQDGPECQPGNMGRCYSFSVSFTKAIKKGAHKTAKEQSSSLGLQATTYLKLNDRVK